MEKLQLLKTPEERHRRLEEIPEIHADHKMDPSYESDDDGSEADNSRQGFFHFLVFSKWKFVFLVPNLLSQ